MFGTESRLSALGAPLWSLFQALDSPVTVPRAVRALNNEHKLPSNCSVPGTRHGAERDAEMWVPATAPCPRCYHVPVCRGGCRNGLWGKLDGRQIARGVRLARLVVEVSKGSDAEDPEYLRAGGTWGLGTDL